MSVEIYWLIIVHLLLTSVTHTFSNCTSLSAAILPRLDFRCDLSRILASPCGMWEDRIRSDLCGDTTIKIHKGWFLLLTLMIEIVLMPQEMNSIECSMRMNWKSQSSWSSLTNKIFLTQCLPLKWLTNLVYMVSDIDHGTFKPVVLPLVMVFTRVLTGYPPLFRSKWPVCDGWISNTLIRSYVVTTGYIFNCKFASVQWIIWFYGCVCASRIVCMVFVLYPFFLVCKSFVGHFSIRNNFEFKWGRLMKRTIVCSILYFSWNGGSIINITSWFYMYIYICIYKICRLVLV